MNTSKGDSTSRGGTSEETKEKEVVKTKTGVDVGKLLQSISQLTASIANHDRVIKDLPLTIKLQSDTNATLASQMEGMKNSIKAPLVDSEMEASKDPFDVINKLQQEPEGHCNNLTADEHNIDEETQSILNQTEEVSEYAESLSPLVAQSFSKIPNQHLNNEKLETLKGLYKPPDNCKLLVVPKVNNKIWGNLPKHVKLKDAKLQASQQLISRALVAQSRMMDMLLDVNFSILKESFQQMLQVTMDTSMSLGHVMRDMNITRRLTINPSLQPQYADLCSSRVPVDEKLFGDNLDQSLKLVKSTANLIKTQVVQKPRFHPYNPTNQLQLKSGQRLNYQPPPRMNGFRRDQFKPRFGVTPRNKPQFQRPYKQHQN